MKHWLLTVEFEGSRTTFAVNGDSVIQIMCKLMECHGANIY